MLHVEGAGPEDLQQMLALAATHRDEYATYEPQFWRSATDARDRQRD